MSRFSTGLAYGRAGGADAAAGGPQDHQPHLGKYLQHRFGLILRCFCAFAVQRHPPALSRESVLLRFSSGNVFNMPPAGTAIPCPSAVRCWPLSPLASPPIPRSGARARLGISFVGGRTSNPPLGVLLCLARPSAFCLWGVSKTTDTQFSADSAIMRPRGSNLYTYSGLLLSASQTARGAGTAAPQHSAL